MEVPPGCANPYTLFEAGIDRDPDAPAIRVRQLGSYLTRRLAAAEILLVAEAPGYQGARFSGIAMTCERTLADRKPKVPASLVLRPGDRWQRTSAAEAGRNAPERAWGFSEPTASIVWSALRERDATDRVVLWNVFPFHPRKPGKPLTNRTPTPREVLSGLPAIEALLALFPGREVVTVGRTAQAWLGQLGIDAPALRHPANGGATAFRTGLGDVFAGGRAG